jgi:hypothetical protein
MEVNEKEVRKSKTAIDMIKTITSPAIMAGAYTDSVRLFRPGEGEDLGKHRVHRLVLGKSGHACVQIN